ncbi:hypothetical protein SPRG_16272 [Saprolegnia parasitica CBS 223.65]|uniref:Uncharacterized protein n=1 Tax=Saprolegnia parasitica (strain CBS 223.65) TaxID=695850 RepID=A0A067BJK6_SAPPC|nr:hypothetical protein SPRG_16272 [Saprolegnia parasitica CBS 223.65]KDO18353.1 hypothetical protein SPRG_16272 [Saprolegnia parasitica CBS 223.65]|eukprot:XP_012210935.1 hypothetical protein SPRG_16272 [Saprolegnia parasitica CBS 223.65]
MTGNVTSVKSKDSLCSHWRRLYQHALAIGGLIVLPLIASDAIVNNWAINAYLGDGKFFFTPIAAAQNAQQLSAQYSYAQSLAIHDLSKIGQWIANATIVRLVTESDDVYVINAGEFPLTRATNLCNVRLALASDSVTFYRGNALTHFFTDDAVANLGNSSMKSTELFELGYVPGRTGTDLRFTHDVLVLNTSTPQSQIVKFYRIFPRTYCTGCAPVAELGHGICNFTYVYNDTTRALRVTNSSFVPGSTYFLGLMMPNSSFGVAALYIKLAAIAIAICGYLAGRRTVQWLEVDPTKVDGIGARACRIVFPKLFPYQSNALSYASFCYNSDLFVFLYALSVLLDLNTSFIFVREVNVYNNLAPQFLYTLQMFALSSRLLWVNCAFLKLLKIGWSLVSAASVNGESTLMGCLNLSSTTSVYLSAVLLFYVPAYIEYNNSVATPLRNVNESIDGIRVRVFDGFYLRVLSSVGVGLVVNLVLVTAADRLWNWRYWQLLAKNSLARQAMYNSSSIVCDFVDGIEPDADGAASSIVCRARRLSTLQWFFMSHLTCFGLPEKELRAKKLSITHVNVKHHHTANSSSRSSSITYPTALPLPLPVPDDGAYMVVQDGDHNIHLLDGQLNDVTSLVYNIKVLKNTTVTIK